MSVPPPIANAPAGGPSAIADVSYRNYDGELRTRALRWWIVTVATIRANVNHKKYGFWIPAVITFLIYFFQAILFYFSKNVRDQMATMGAMPGGVPNPYAMTFYTSLLVTHLFTFIAAMTIGSAVIAADNRANALLVYLSKPMTRTDYLVGKWMGVFLLLAGMTLVPALLLFLFFAVSYNDEGFLKENPTMILRVVGATLLPAAIHASLILGFSAWSKTPRLAGAFYAALYFVSGILAGKMSEVALQKDTNNEHPQTAAIVRNLSIDGATNGIAMHLYDVTPEQVVNQMENGGRRKPKQPQQAGTNQTTKNAPVTASPTPEAQTPPPPRTFNIAERPNLSPMLLLASILIAAPLVAAYMKVRAVEVVRG